MSTRPVTRISVGQVLVICIAAAVPVGVAIVLADDRRAVAAPAIAIGVVVVIAEVLFEHFRAENRELRHELNAERALRGTKVHDFETAEQTTVTPPAAPPREAPKERRPVPITQFLSQDRRADDLQCPRCGRFDVDVELGKRWSLDCRACGHTWTWQPGTPWPDVTVVADLTRIELS
jgi:ribosomal protein L37AE/L43A